jgi:CRISPR/Cas system-associated endonuclease/helicase Cas3
MLFIIHYNPGSEKTRGHLGSHLERKSETNLRLEKDKTGVTKLWADKNRRAPISKETGPRFAWSDEAEMHVSVPSNWTQKGHDKSNRLRAEAVTVFAVNTDSAISHGELVGRLKAELDVSVSTAKRRFNEMLEAEIIRKQGMGYSLN